MTLLHRKPKLQSNFQSRLSSLLYPPSSFNVSFKCYSSSCEKSWCLLALPALCVVVGLPLRSATLGEGKRKSEIGTWVLIFTDPWMFSSRAHSDFTDVCITLWGRVKMSALGGSAHHPKYRQWKLWADNPLQTHGVKLKDVTGWMFTEVTGRESSLPWAVPVTQTSEHAGTLPMFIPHA